MKRVVEFRSYSLKPGTRDEFHRLVLSASMPLLDRWGVDVVDFGPSLHDETSYYLVRAYDGLEERKASQDSFYGSTDWKEGPRDAIVGLIESYTTVVVEMEDAVIDSLRKAS